MAQLDHNNSHNVPEMVSFVFLAHVVYHLLVSAVALVQLAPVHQLPQGAQLVYRAYFVTSVDYLQASAYVLVLKPFQQIQLVF